MSTVTITAADINKLRQTTGAGMMDCRKALTETNGDFEAAIDWLRKKGQKVAALRGDRDAKEGVIHALVSDDAKVGVLVEVCCETDFVAKNDDFRGFVSTIATSRITPANATGKIPRIQPEKRPSAVSALISRRNRSRWVIVSDTVSSSSARLPPTSRWMRMAMTAHMRSTLVMRCAESSSASSSAATMRSATPTGGSSPTSTAAPMTSS